MLPAVDGLMHSPAVWIVLAYLVGAIPMGVLIARSRGIDLRSVGSGNIGATNAVRAMGGRWGLVVFALDAVKAAVPVVLAQRPFALGEIHNAEIYVASTALAAVLGHMFPVYLGFRGGKGVACAFGAILALDPLVALGGLVLYAQALVLTRKSAVGSLTAVTAMTLTVLLAERSNTERALVLALAVLIWARHHTNVRALWAEGTRRDGETTSPTGQ